MHAMKIAARYTYPKTELINCVEISYQELMSYVR